MTKPDKRAIKRLVDAALREKLALAASLAIAFMGQAQKQLGSLGIQHVRHGAPAGSAA